MKPFKYGSHSSRDNPPLKARAIYQFLEKVSELMDFIDGHARRRMSGDSLFFLSPNTNYVFSLNLRHSVIMLAMDFQLVTSYTPRGDQPRAIAELMQGLAAGEKHQVLLGVTGSGKTFTMAKIIEQSNRPALILAHNKTLAAQLYHEFKQFFPNNAVEYFVSYYDYYQPEAYIPAGDLYIEK